MEKEKKNKKIKANHITSPTLLPLFSLLSFLTARITHTTNQLITHLENILAVALSSSSSSSDTSQLYQQQQQQENPQEQSAAPPEEEEEEQAANITTTTTTTTTNNTTSASAITTATDSLQLSHVETGALIHAAEEFMRISRVLKEIWLLESEWMNDCDDRDLDWLIIDDGWYV